MVVIGIDHDLFDHNFWVYQNELQLVLAWSNIPKVDFEPADIIKDLVATEHLAPILPAAEQKVVVWRQGLQLLRLRKVLGRVFTKLVMQSLTGIVYRCLR